VYNGLPRFLADYYISLLVLFYSLSKWETVPFIHTTSFIVLCSISSLLCLSSSQFFRSLFGSDSLTSRKNIEPCSGFLNHEYGDFSEFWRELMSTPTVRSCWSQWVVIVGHCWNLWWRWWSDASWVTLILYDCTHYYVILNLLLWWFWWDLQNWSDLWMRIVMGRSSKSLCRYVSKVSTVNKMLWYNTGMKTFLLQPISCKFRDLHFCFRIPQILWQEKAHHLG
jgi:hypothetical protein